MSREKTSNMVEAHAEGEVGRMITGGVLDPPGRTTLDKMNHLNNVDDSLRRIIGSRFGVLFEGPALRAGREREIHRAGLDPRFSPVRHRPCRSVPERLRVVRLLGDAFDLPD